MPVRSPSPTALRVGWRFGEGLRYVWFGKFYDRTPGALEGIAFHLNDVKQTTPRQVVALRKALDLAGQSRL